MSDSTLFKNSATFEQLAAQPSRSPASYEARFQWARKHIPAPGYNRGCHRSLLGVATLGILAGHTDDEIFVSIRVAIPEGKRVVGDKDIWDAISRAHVDTAPAGSNPSARPSVEIVRRKKLSEAEAKKERERVLSYSTGPVNLDSDEFRRAHGFQLEPQPIMAIHPEAFTMIQLIGELYDPDKPLYIGSEYMEDSGKNNIRPAGEWIEHFKGQQKTLMERIGNDGWHSSTPSAFLLNLGMRYSHIVPNPVTGCFGKTKDGGLSLRCDGSIRSFKYAVIDFDKFGLDKQSEILHCLCEALDIRICALIKTGGREGSGTHAWVKIDGVDSLEAWNKKVRDGLFPIFEALGADPACANPSRGSRLPGVYRWGTDRWQKLLFVSREGVRI